MRLIIGGLGPGERGLISESALAAARKADVIIVPCASLKQEGQAERIMRHYLPAKKVLRAVFPMTRDIAARTSRIRAEIEGLRSEWEGASTIFFPVIGDAMLYSTGAYMLEVMRELEPEIEADFVPGISAHSLAASCAKRFLAQGEEIFTIIPCTADEERIRAALSVCDCAALYKPTALRNLRELVSEFSRIVRVDYAGFPDRERIIEGAEALNDIHDYMTVILLWRNS